jgi:hypothetical protein
MVASHPVQAIHKLMVIVSFVRCGTLQEIDHLRYIVRRAKAEYKMDVVAQYTLFQEMDFHIFAFGLKKPVEKVAHFSIDERFSFVGHKHDMVIKRITVMVRFVRFV